MTSARNAWADRHRESGRRPGLWEGKGDGAIMVAGGSQYSEYDRRSISAGYDPSCSIAVRRRRWASVTRTHPPATTVPDDLSQHRAIDAARLQSPKVLTAVGQRATTDEEDIPGVADRPDADAVVGLPSPLGPPVVVRYLPHAQDTIDDQMAGRIGETAQVVEVERRVELRERDRDRHRPAHGSVGRIHQDDGSRPGFRQSREHHVAAGRRSENGDCAR